MIQYFSDYYEDVEKHYISGTFYAPIVSDIVWEGGIAKVFDYTNNKEIEIKIYKDRFSKKGIITLFLFVRIRHIHN